MWSLVSVFVEIALRRRGPESLPDSSFLVLALLAVYVPVGLVYVILQRELTLSFLALFAIDTALIFAFVFAVLRFFKLERRYRQTMSAMLGVSIVITVVYLPVAFVALALGAEVTQAPFSWVLIALFLWSMFINGFILARALSQPLIVGLMFEILLFLTASSIQDLLMPASGLQ